MNLGSCAGPNLAVGARLNPGSSCFMLFQWFTDTPDGSWWRLIAVSPGSGFVHPTVTGGPLTTAVEHAVAELSPRCGSRVTGARSLGAAPLSARQETCCGHHLQGDDHRSRARVTRSSAVGPTGTALPVQLPTTRTVNAGEVLPVGGGGGLMAATETVTWDEAFGHLGGGDRESDPAWPKRSMRLTHLVVGVLVMVSVALGAGLWHLRSPDQVTVLTLTRPIERGETLSAGDVRAVQVASNDDLAGIDAEAMPEVVGRTALIDLPRGTLLTPELTASAINVGDGDSEALADGAPTSADNDDNRAVATLAAVTLAGLAIAALGVVANRAVEHRRRRARIQDPDPCSWDTAAQDRQAPAQLVTGANDDGIGDLRTLLGCLAEDLAEAGAACRPRLLQHGADHLDLFLSRPSAEPPTGWTAEAGGAVWTHAGHEVAVRSTETCATPLLVTLGQPDEDGQLYLDLEAEGRLTLAGDTGTARAVARSIITEVALGQSADTVRIIVIGDLLEPGAAGLDHVSVVDDWDNVENDIADWVEKSHRALSSGGWANAFIARGARSDKDSLDALLVVASKAAPTALMNTIAVNQPAAIATVMVGEDNGTQRVIKCEANQLTVIDVGLTCVPQAPGEGALDTVVGTLLDPAPEIAHEEDNAPGTTIPMGGALRQAQSFEREQLWVLPGEGGNEARADDGSPTRESHPADEGLSSDYDIIVRYLGNIRVEGGKALQGKATAAVAYLALHRTATVEALEDACWNDPRAGSTRKRLKNVMSEARAAIGAQHLPAAADGRYSTGPRVTTDLQLFEGFLDRAATQSGAAQANTYASALDLVTGKPFTYPSRSASSFVWIDLENLRSHWEVRIEGLAQRCAETYLTLGDTGEAVAVLRQTLKSIPLNTCLTEALMRSHAAAGELDAVHAVYEEHAKGLKAMTHDDPVASTQALLQELRQTETRSGSPRR